MRRQAVREAQASDMWTRREALARERGMPDLAEGARTRAERHARMARILEQRADEMRIEIERLRRTVAPARSVGRSPPTDGDLEARLNDLEIEREIEAIRSRLLARRAENRDPNEP